MLLLSGPAWCGNSRQVLEQVRSALRRGAEDFRLIVPAPARTRDRLAREGFFLRPGCVVSLAEFIRPWTKNLADPPSGTLEVLVAGALTRAARPEFEKVGRLPGFWGRLAKLLEELSAAGCDARRLARLIEAHSPDAPLAAASAAVYKDVERELDQRGWGLALNRLRRAQEEIRDRGLSGLRAVFFDGFTTFSEPELGLIDAIRIHADVTVALPAWSGSEVARAALLMMGFDEQPVSAAGEAAAEAVSTASIEDEAEEIACQIVEEVSAGRSLGEIAIVLRDEARCAPLLRTVLERSGIPARFHLPAPLARHAIVRYLAGVADAMLGGWEHEQTLTALRMEGSAVAGTEAGDRFDFAVRARLPGHGLEILRECTDDPGLRALLDRCRTLESWRAFRLPAREWAARTRTLRGLAQPPRIAACCSQDLAALWRSRAAALDAFDTAMGDTAAALEADCTVSFAEFWRAARVLLEGTPFRAPDLRRHAVHVLDFREPGPWEFPVVFFCGLTGTPPQRLAEDELLPDAARGVLRRSGLCLSRVAERRREEEFLLARAAASATSRLVLTYPEFDAGGAPNLPVLSRAKTRGAPPARAGCEPERSGMVLTNAQWDAIRRMGQNVCVTGSPGTGKTRVLRERFLWRVEQGIPPARILALTFTPRAANELRRELLRAYRERTDLREQVESACISTVSGFCERLLREHALAAGLEPQFELMDAGGAAVELTVAAEDAWGGLLQEYPEAARALLGAVDFADPPAALAEAYEGMRLTFVSGPQEPAVAEVVAFPGAFRKLSEALKRIAALSSQNGGAARSAGLKEWSRRAPALLEAPASPLHFEALAACDAELQVLVTNGRAHPEVHRVRNALLPAARQALAGAYYAPQRALLWEALVRLADRYRDRKQARNTLDPLDLLELSVGLLRDQHAFRRQIQDRFDEVLVDDLQNTNPLEQTLLDLVSRPGRFFAAGDLNQSIYGFRHAEPEVLKRYREQLRAKGQRVDGLRGTYRSRSDILAAVETILVGAPGLEPHPLEPARRFPEKAEPSVELLAAMGANLEEAEAFEARWVAHRIRELAGCLPVGDRTARFGDMAVLVRDAEALKPFEKALRECGIPFESVRGRGLLDAQEVAGLVSLLRVLVNPRDEVSLAAVLRSPLAGIGDETLLRLKDGGSFCDVLATVEDHPPAGLDSEGGQRLIRLRRLVEELRAQSDDLSPDHLLARAIGATGYEAALDSPARANVRSFLGLLRNRYARTPMPLRAVLLELDRHSCFEQRGEALDGGSDAVRLGTIHSASGREFPVVFLAALRRETRRPVPAMAFSLRGGLVARWREPVSGEPVADRPYALFAEEHERRRREEEDRLLYVAMTRAEEHLLFSFALTGGRPHGWAEKVVSGLGVPLSGDGPPLIHTCERGRRPFPVRVLAAMGAPRPGPRTFQALALRSPSPAVEPYDEAVSVNDVWLFAHCPRRYFLARYVGWNAQPGVVTAARAELNPGGEELGELEMTAITRQVHALLAGREVRNAERSAVGLASRFEGSELGRRAACAERCETAFDFMLELEGVVLKGRIDLWFIEGGELVLVDYKAGEVAAADADARYGLQVRLYALALERFVGRRPDHGYVYLLRPNVPVGVSLEAERMAEASQTVRALRDAQSSRSFPPRLSTHCRRCPYYRGLCPA